MSDGNPISATSRVLSVPHRVLRTIRVEQSQSELLIGWIELALVVTFATLYAIAPKTAPVDAPFNPVPWVLLAYFCVVAVRLWLACRDQLGPALLMASAIVDMALLMALIWSFHLQYHEPPAFYLKAPTFAYVFIFIALRALRFEPRYVVAAGLAAMAGWAVLVVFAVWNTPGTPITRDYVAYVYRPVVLLGAEFDKLITIAVVTAILALALHRGRRLLIRAASDAEAARDLKRFFAPEIATRITSAEQPLCPGQGESRSAAVLQVDIKGFTAHAAVLPPDRVIALLTTYQALVAPIVRRHGGSIDKFMGDGVMATFGAFGPSDTYAADAIRAALEVVAAIEAWRGAGGSTLCRTGALATVAPPANLQIGVAIAHGEVVVGAIGEPDRLDYTVVGTPVNLAAKVEKHTRIEGVPVLALAATVRLAEAQGLQLDGERRVRTRAVAGVGEPLELVVLSKPAA